jgi:hypothetical protein
MDDPFVYFYYLLIQQQQQYSESSSFIDNLTFWIVVATVVPMLVKFFFLHAAYSKFMKALFGQLPYELKTRLEIEAERQHSYKKWGTGLCLVSIIGGFILFVIGITGHSDFEIAGVGKITNAAPGTILFVIGFLIWKQAHK